MDWIIYSRTYLVTTGENEPGIFVDSVYMVMFSVDPYRVLIEGDIMRTNVFLLGL